MPAIALLGDVMLGRGVAEQLRGTPPAALWSAELRELLHGCDAVICNLECCVSERGSPTTRIPGKPFFFRAPPAATASLEAISATAVGLANNHALDYGTEALVDTLDYLRGAGIPFCGAGADIAEARAGLVVKAGEVRVGIVAASDHPREFAACPDEPGIAYAELPAGMPPWLAQELADLRATCDLVLAFLHWGPNMTTRPARWQRRLGEDLLRAGTDAVAGHSAHVFHGIATGPAGTIFYDLGDAIDDYAVDRVLRNDLGVFAIWRPGNDPEVEIVGLRLHLAHTEIAAGADADWIAARLERACKKLGTAVERTGEARFALSTA